jgi:hypothetical protein
MTVHTASVPAPAAAPVRAARVASNETSGRALARAVAVETRKLVNTRIGPVLIAAAALLSGAFAGGRALFPTTGTDFGQLASTSMIHRGVLWCDLRLVEPQDGWILAVGVLIRPGCPGGCRFHCGGLLVLSVGRWFGGYWGQPGWRDQMRVQALTRSSAQAQSSGSFKIW